MRPVTLAIHQDEKAMSLREISLVRPPSYQRRRYQIVTVARNDRLTEWWDDLGPAERFTAPGIEIPSFWEHTVAELQDIAERQRLGSDYWRKYAEERQQESTLIPDFLSQKEEWWSVINNRSAFGPGVSKQRNGFPKRAAQEAGNGRRIQSRG